MTSTNTGRRPLLWGAAAVAILAAGAWYFHGADPAKPVITPATSSGTAKETTVSTDPKPEHNPREQHEQRPADAPILIPARYRFAGIESMQAADDEEEMYARYSIENQETLKAYYGAYASGFVGAAKQYYFANAFSFHNQKQLEWLIASGFPTPDEVLAAKNFSDDELRDLSDSGDFKASAFLLKRQAAALAEQSQETSPGTRDPEHKRMSLENRKLEHYLLSEPSPFSAYAVAAYSQATDRPSRVLAAYQLAEVLGDNRGRLFAGYYQAAHTSSSQPIETGAALVSFRGMMQEMFAGRNSPDFRIVRRRPEFEVYEVEHR